MSPDRFYGRAIWFQMLEGISGIGGNGRFVWAASAGAGDGIPGTTMSGSGILNPSGLLELDFGSCLFEFLLSLLSGVLSGTFEDGCRGAFNQLLGISKTQTW